jgi:hypothetical protein
MRSAIVRGDYERARRKSFVRAIASWLRRSDNALLAFDEMRRGIHAQATRDGGLHEVPIDQIVGSVGRYRDFDRAFLPRQVRTRDRWESVDRAHREGTEVPAIELYKIGEVYFVKDGNHRVSVARERGQAFIDAHVIEVTAPAPVDSVEDLLDFIRDRDALAFYEKTDLLRLRPDTRIELTLPGQYDKLLEHISTHRWYLGVEQKREIPYPEAVASWYDRVYMPTVEVIRKTDALRDFPNRTEADLYLWCTEHHWYLHQAAHPKGESLEAIVSDYAGENSERPLRPLLRRARATLPGSGRKTRSQAKGRATP